MLPCIAAVAIATFVGTKAIKSDADESDNLLMANVEALSSPSDAGTNYHYSEAKGKAKFCTLYVYIEASGSVAASSETPISSYEGNVKYKREKRDGLKDKCPEKGKGCNPFSCTSVTYVP